MKPVRIGTFIFLSTLALIACSRAPEEVDAVAADRVFLNGAIYTVDNDRSWAEAVAIKDGRIIYVATMQVRVAISMRPPRLRTLDGK